MHVSITFIGSGSVLDTMVSQTQLKIWILHGFVIQQIRYTKYS